MVLHCPSVVQHIVVNFFHIPKSNTKIMQLLYPWFSKAQPSEGPLGIPQKKKFKVIQNFLQDFNSIKLYNESYHKTYLLMSLKNTVNISAIQF